MESNEFEQIVSEHYESLYRFAFGLAHAEDDARDLTQQSFYVLAAKGDQLQDRTKVKTWLFTTLYRAFLQGRRRRQRFPHIELDEVHPEASPLLVQEPVNEADHTVVLAAVAQLDEVYRAAVTLFYLEDCRYQEIAWILQIPIGTVKSRIARGVARLRELLLQNPSPCRSRAMGQRKYDESPSNFVPSLRLADA